MRLEYNLRMIKEKTTSAFLLQASIRVGELYFSLYFSIENDIFFSYYSNYFSDYLCSWSKGDWVSSIKDIESEWLIS